jgi:hypothetical protein
MEVTTKKKMEKQQGNQDQPLKLHVSTTLTDCSMRASRKELNTEALQQTIDYVRIVARL